MIYSPSSVINIASNINRTEGSAKFKVHLNTGRIKVEHNPGVASDEKLMNIPGPVNIETDIA